MKTYIWNKINLFRLWYLGRTISKKLSSISKYRFKEFVENNPVGLRRITNDEFNKQYISFYTSDNLHFQISDNFLHLEFTLNYPHKNTTLVLFHYLSLGKVLLSVCYDYEYINTIRSEFKKILTIVETAESEFLKEDLEKANAASETIRKTLLGE